MKSAAEVVFSLGRALFGLIVVGGATVLFLMPMSRFPDGDARVRAQVSRAKSDMRTMAVALEAYHADHGTWPPVQRVSGYPPELGTPFPALSTPVAYAAASFDPFATGRAIALHTQQDGYVMISPGPDRRIDLPQPSGYYRGGDFNGSVARLVTSGLTYDPTNGTESAGDLWRVREP